MRPSPNERVAFTTLVPGRRKLWREAAQTEAWKFWAAGATALVEEMAQI